MVHHKSTAICVCQNYQPVLVLVCFRSNKQECPASVFVSGTVEPDALVVTKVNLEHTCSLQQYLDDCYPSVQMDVPAEVRQSKDTQISFDVHDTSTASLLQNMNNADLELNDMSNCGQQIQPSDEFLDEVQVTAATAALFEVCFD